MFSSLPRLIRKAMEVINNLFYFTAHMKQYNIFLWTFFCSNTVNLKCLVPLDSILGVHWIIFGISFYSLGFYHRHNTDYSEKHNYGKIKMDQNGSKWIMKICGFKNVVNIACIATCSFNLCLTLLNLDVFYF